MSDFKLLAVQAALNKMVSGNHFDICTVDCVIKALELKPDSGLYNELRLLHCVHYGDMPAALLEQLPTKLMQLLDCPRMDASRINVVPSGTGLRLVCHE